MTREQAVFALEAGIRAAEDAFRDGCDVLVAGEMGIGNTTSSTAVLCALLGLDPEAVTGRGSGLDDAGLRRKVAAIRSCIEVNRPDPNDGLDVLNKCGGFDIAAICGVYLAGAALGVPVVLDGLISNAAAMLAVCFSAKAADALLPRHMSHEPGGHAALDALGLRAPIVADLALGEGTGGVALLPLLGMALAVLNGEHSFASIGMEAYKPQM
jgi:nicotinate-nucleotide--dimethylbenzimidazole phosphoribosyltransferase